MKPKPKRSRIMEEFDREILPIWNRYEDGRTPAESKGIEDTRKESLKALRAKFKFKQVP